MLIFWNFNKFINLNSFSSSLQSGFVKKFEFKRKMELFRGDIGFRYLLELKKVCDSKLHFKLKQKCNGSEVVMGFGSGCAKGPEIHFIVLKHKSKIFHVIGKIRISESVFYIIHFSSFSLLFPYFDSIGQFIPLESFIPFTLRSFNRLIMAMREWRQ